MQASDDFTTHTQGMVYAYITCGEIRQSIISSKNFEDIYNPSTRKRESLEIDVLQSLADGVFHVMINLPHAVSIEDEQVEDWIEYKELDRATIVNSTCTMMDNIFDEMKEDYEVSWWARDCEDVWCDVGEGGLMVVVLKAI